MKQVLIYSIQPEHVLNFLNGRKTIEVRKRDLPQWAKESLARGEVVEGYGYCTKGKPYLEPRECNGEFVWNIHNDFIYHTDLNGKVVFKFRVKDVIHYEKSEQGYQTVDIKHFGIHGSEMLKHSCLTKDEWYAYGNGADLYAHHFTNITPIEPMELGEFVSDKLVVNVCGSEFKCYNETASYFARKDQRLTKAPQSFMTAWVKEVEE